MKMKATIAVQNLKKKVFLDYLRNNLDDIYKELWMRTVDVIYNEAQSVSKKAVDTFYAEYPGRNYDPTEDLYNAYKVRIINGYEFSFELGADFMEHYHHQGNEFVYENSFVRGWHGGSAGTDKSGATVTTPHFRMPPGIFSRWGAQAPRSSSPYQYIKSRLSIFNTNVFIPYQRKIFRGMLIDIRRKMR